RFPAIEAGGLLLARRLTPMVLPAVGAGAAGGPPGQRVEVTLLDGRLGSGVELVLFDVPGLYDRPSVYGEGGVDYPDNALRFGLFSRAVVELVRQRARAGTPFDIVHAHDWPAAMVPYLLREHAAELSRTRTVLTIHNLAHQGVFPADALVHLGLGPEHFTTERLEFYGQVSFLKGGILAADALTTVSNTYAREILTPELGERLEGVLSTRQD